jgi:hypothetical protein
MRFSGVVGYGASEEDPEDSGRIKQVITEIPYSGTVERNVMLHKDDEKVNSDISVQNQISIVADAYALANFMAIKYVVWNGVCWKVSNVDASQRPRLILTPGEVYNGQRPSP